MYIRVDADVPDDFPSRYHPTPVRGEPTGPGNVEVPPEFKQEIMDLRITLRDHKKDNFAIDVDGMRLRGVRYKVVNGTTWVSLRRISTTLPDLEKLGFEPDILKIFRAWGKRTGLIIIGGSTGSGKTTTAVGLMRDYLINMGGTLYTVEDPVEFVMQGSLGDRGFVLQREVQEDDEWAEAVKDALRSAPNYIFVGEVRTAAAARQLLRAATSGHLALCTVHGSSVEETIGAILQIAERELGPMAYNLLAEGLTGVIYQNIVRGKPQVMLLQTEGGKGGADPVRTSIRANKLIMLGTEIERQAALRAQAAARPGRKMAQDAVADDGEEGEATSSGTGQPTGQAMNRVTGQPMRAGTPPVAPGTSFGAPPPKANPRPVVRPAPPPPAAKKGGWFNK